jgi:NAD(P)-dependent dehydrogenase (short-subunit alcohol dehydrogenase family)
MGLLNGRSAIITGSGQGIGRTTAELFLKEGARVGVAELRDDSRAGTVSLLREKYGTDSVIDLPVDVTDSVKVGRMVDAAVKAFERIDILVNNAGTSWGAVGLDVSDEDWRDIIALNLTGQFNCVRAVVPHMKRQRYGKLVGIASDSGRFRSYATGFPYVAAKAGVHGMYRRLGEELGPWNITANVISPGNVLTEEGRKYMELPAMRDLLRDCPMGRWTEPEELASAVLFYASDLSSHVTGVTMSVNGGWHMVW